MTEDFNNETDNYIEGLDSHKKLIIISEIKVEKLCDDKENIINKDMED